jgi:multiple sugar transport system permease protein
MRNRRMAWRWVGVVLILLWSLVPIYWTINISLQTEAQLGSKPAHYVPPTPTLKNYAALLTGSGPVPGQIRASAVNIVVECAAATIITVVLSTLAAYAFARMKFRGKGILFTVFLATLMIPGEATLIPKYVLMSPSRVACAGLPCLGWFDTYQVQIVPFIASAFSIFLMRQFFLSIPNELADAARIDGAGHLRFLWSVVLPLSVPALITAGLITFLGSWNAFQWPLIVTSKPDFRPVQVGLSAFRQEAGSSYHLLMAASTFVVAPIVLLFLVAQRYLVQGIARTGIRG